jgi:transaldolase
MLSQAVKLLGIDLEEVTSEIEAEGVESFIKSLRHLLDTLSQKAEPLRGASS